MNDFISFVAFMLLGYVCCVGFVVATVRILFPFKTKEEWARVHALRSAVQSQQRLSRVSGASVAQSRQLA
ncbi:MAG: hypothetical protein ABI477_04615 [Chryseolinea sp.]